MSWFYNRVRLVCEVVVRARLDLRPSQSAESWLSLRTSLPPRFSRLQECTDVVCGYAESSAILFSLVALRWVNLFHLRSFLVCLLSPQLFDSLPCPVDSPAPIVKRKRFRRNREANQRRKNKQLTNNRRISNASKTSKGLLVDLSSFTNTICCFCLEKLPASSSPLIAKAY
jgi:hypothetical protein